MVAADVTHGIFFLDIQQQDLPDVETEIVFPTRTVIWLQLQLDNYIEPVLSALRRHYQSFTSLSIATNSMLVKTQLEQFFPELCRRVQYSEQNLQQLTVTETAQLAACGTALPAFAITVSEPLLSPALTRLKDYFMLDARITDIADIDTISSLTDELIQQLSVQQCAFSAFVQIRLLSYYSEQLNHYGNAYFKSLALGLGDQHCDLQALWALVSDRRFSVTEQFFIYNQIASLDFNGKTKDKSDFGMRLAGYQSIVRAMYNVINLRQPFIDIAQRDPKLVFVFLAQFLGIRHAPSKIALDIIKDLSAQGIQAVMIDSCELMPRQGSIPWFGAAYANRANFNTELIEYEGVSFNYVQLSDNMPSANEMLSVLNLVNSYRPYFCVTVGESIVADMCSQLVPNVVVPTVARLPHTLSQFRLADPSISRDGVTITDTDFLQGILDYRMVPKISSSDAAKPSLSDGPFNIAIIGNRLDVELKDDFFRFLASLLPFNVRFIFIGEFANYPDWCQKYAFLLQHAESKGFQSELTTALAGCHAFLNYPRVGGGHSALYAMRAGLPVLTLKHCDVYSVAGSGFDSYADIKQEILQLIASEDYLQQQSLQALKKAAAIVEQRSDITELITMLSSSPLFNRPGFVNTDL